MNNAYIGAIALVIALGAAGAARADQIPVTQAKQWCQSGYVGPRTAYGETRSEAADKKLVYAWACMALVERKPDLAFKLYVSPDFCDHSHMVTAGLKECADFTATEKSFERMANMLSKNGKIEFPVAAAVNGDMVTQYGAGVDVFRVQNGKITDHWDASPPIDISLMGHNQAFSDRMQAQIDSGKHTPGLGLIP